MLIEVEINSAQDLYSALDRIGDAIKKVDPADPYTDELISKFKYIAEREGYGSANKLISQRNKKERNG